MPSPHSRSVRRRVPGLVIGAALTFAVSSPAPAADVTDMLYTFAVTAPAVEAECEAAMPGYAASFDHYFAEFLEANAQEIAASKQVVLDANPGKTQAEVDTMIVDSAKADFAKFDLPTRQEACQGLMGFLAAARSD